MKHPHFEAEKTLDRSRYVLPFRDLAQYQFAGWIAFGLGILGCMFILAWMSGPALAGIEAIQQNDQAGFFQLGFASLGLAGLYACFQLLTAGVAIVRRRSHTIIQITERYLASTEVIGWFRWKRKVQTRNVSGIVIQRSSEALPNLTGDSLPNDLWSAIATIHSAPDDNNAKQFPRAQFPIAVAYPQTVIQSLASELATQLNQKIPLAFDADSFGKNQTVTVKESLTHDSGVPLNKPEGSRIETLGTTQGLTFQIPPSGYRGHVNSLRWFGRIWIGFVAVLGLFFLFTDIIQGRFGVPEFLVSLGVLAFSLPGFGMLIFARHLAISSVMIGVRDNQLIIEKTTMFGKRWREYSKWDIARITKGASGTEINDEPVLELQVIDAQGDKFGITSAIEHAGNGLARP